MSIKPLGKRHKEASTLPIYEHKKPDVFTINFSIGTKTILMEVPMEEVSLQLLSERACSALSRFSELPGYVNELNTYSPVRQYMEKLIDSEIDEMSDTDASSVLLRIQLSYAIHLQRYYEKLKAAYLHIYLDLKKRLDQAGNRKQVPQELQIELAGAAYLEKYLKMLFTQILFYSSDWIGQYLQTLPRELVGDEKVTKGTQDKEVWDFGQLLCNLAERINKKYEVQDDLEVSDYQKILALFQAGVEAEQQEAGQSELSVTGVTALVHKAFLFNENNANLLHELSEFSSYTEVAAPLIDVFVHFRKVFLVALTDPSHALHPETVAFSELVMEKSVLLPIKSRDNGQISMRQLSFMRQVAIAFFWDDSLTTVPQFSPTLLNFQDIAQSTEPSLAPEDIPSPVYQAFASALIEVNDIFKLNLLTTQEITDRAFQYIDGPNLQFLQQEIAQQLHQYAFLAKGELVQLYVANLFNTNHPSCPVIPAVSDSYLTFLAEDASGQSIEGATIHFTFFAFPHEQNTYADTKFSCRLMPHDDTVDVEFMVTDPEHISDQLKTAVLFYIHHFLETAFPQYAESIASQRAEELAHQQLEDQHPAPLLRNEESDDQTFGSMQALNPRKRKNAHKLNGSNGTQKEKTPESESNFTDGHDTDPRQLETERRMYNNLIAHMELTPDLEEEVERKGQKGSSSGELKAAVKFREEFNNTEQGNKNFDLERLGLTRKVVDVVRGVARDGINDCRVLLVIDEQNVGWIFATEDRREVYGKKGEQTQTAKTIADRAMAILKWRKETYEAERKEAEKKNREAKR